LINLHDRPKKREFFGRAISAKRLLSAEEIEKALAKAFSFAGFYPQTLPAKGDPPAKLCFKLRGSVMVFRGEGTALFPKLLGVSSKPADNRRPG